MRLVRTRDFVPVGAGSSAARPLAMVLAFCANMAVFVGIIGGVVALFDWDLATVAWSLALAAILLGLIASIYGQLWVRDDFWQIGRLFARPITSKIQKTETPGNKRVRLEMVTTILSVLTGVCGLFLVFVMSIMDRGVDLVSLALIVILILLTEILYEVSSVLRGQR
jgi:hypothetical protein